MASSKEFDVIDRLIRHQAAWGQPFHQDPQALGIGDDAALIPPLRDGEQMVVSTDMLVEGRHYRASVDPRSLGHKALAVNLSDLAAMGARPVACTLSAGLRDIDEPWITAFLEGFLALAREVQCPLIGGDTVGVPVGSPQIFSVTVMGAAPLPNVDGQGGALRRDGVRLGDDLWVSGALGDAAWAVQSGVSDVRLDWPSPRLALGLALRESKTAHAAIDVSDGLTSEIGHLLKASSQKQGALMGARLQWSALPLGDRLRALVDSGQMSWNEARVLAAAGGDDYELLFSAPPSARDELVALSNSLRLPLTRIGEIILSDQSFHLDWRDDQQQPLSSPYLDAIRARGFHHFSDQQ